MKRSLASSVLPRLPLTSEIYGPPRGFYSTLEDYNASVQGYAPIHTEQVNSGELILLGGAKTVDKAPHWKFEQSGKLTTDPESISWIKGARVVGEKVALIMPDDRVMLPYSYMFAPYYHKLFYTPKLPPIRDLAGITVMIATANTHGYAHWLHDCLPRYGFVREFATVQDHEINQFIIGKRSRFVDHSLDILGIPEEKRLYTDASFHVRCETLIFPQMGHHGNPTQWEIQFFRESLLDPVLRSADPHRDTLERIYISRENAAYRRIRNRAAVEQLLAEYGFAKVLLEQHSFAEQVLLMHDASIVLGAHGAGLANTVFCRPGATVIEIFPVDKVNLVYFTTCFQAGVNYYYLISEGDRPEDRGDYFSNWNTQSEIDCNLDQLRETVETVIRSQSQ